jgi:starch synthase
MARPLRVAYLVTAPGIPVQGPSGSSAHVRAMAEAFGAQTDLRVYAACDVDHRGRFGPEVPATISGVGGWPSWLSRYRDMIEVGAARRIARQVIEDAQGGWWPDLVVERHTLFSDAAWRVGATLGVPWVLEVNAPPVQERARYEVLRRPAWAAEWEGRVLRAAPLVIAVSRWLVRWLEDDIGCRRVRWVPNGVHTFQGNRARGRALMGVEEDTLLVGFVGSMKPWHGHKEVIHIAREVGARPVLIGHVSAAMQSAHGPDLVAPGFLSGGDLADAIKALDVALAPYPEDAPPWFCPLKVLDYRAQGVPVVASKTGEVRMLVGNGGQVVTPGDRKSSVGAVRAWMGRQPRPRVRSWETVARRILDVAEQELEVRGRSDR